MSVVMPTESVVTLFAGKRMGFTAMTLRPTYCVQHKYE